MKRYTMYIGDIMKKTEYISFRTDQETKKALEQIAIEKKWSISQLSEEIIKEWLSKQEAVQAGNQ